MALCAVLVLACLPQSFVWAQEPSLYATAAVLMDADSGRILYEKNGCEFLSNASTTKIMTCIIALENADLNERVEVSAYAAGMPKVKLFMQTGEHFILRDLLYSLMLESHNDSAVAIAEHVGQSVEGFAVMMNEKAREIGCENTWFITPNGLDATQSVTEADGSIVTRFHGTTAADLARIMAYCAFESPMKDTFLEITRTSAYSFSSEEGRSFSCTNHNAFLSMMDGALSGKTGFTNQAGYCYVGALERDGKRFTLALLACGWPNNKSYKWSDSRELFSYGLENYRYLTFEPEIVLQPVPVAGAGAKDGNPYHSVETKLYRQQTEPIRLLACEEEKVEAEVSYVKTLMAPVAAGTRVGKVEYYLVDKTGQRSLLKEEGIYTTQDWQKIDYMYCLNYVFDRFLFFFWHGVFR